MELFEYGTLLSERGMELAGCGMQLHEKLGLNL